MTKDNPDFGGILASGVKGKNVLEKLMESHGGSRRDDGGWSFEMPSFVAPSNLQHFLRMLKGCYSTFMSAPEDVLDCIWGLREWDCKGDDACRCDHLLADHPGEHLQEFMDEIDRAEIVIWDGSVFESAIAGAEVFVGSEIPEIVRGKLQFWIFQTGAVGVNARKWMVEQGSSTFGFLVDSNADGVFSVKTAIQPEGGSLRLRCFQTNKKRPVGISHILADFVAASTFLESEIIVPERVNWTRPFRKEAKRLNKTLPLVRIIALRKTISRGLVDSNGSTVEWSHRWMVRGHWRNQWYSKEQTHKIKFVKPHIKGPEGKPLLPPRDTIFRAIR